MYWFEGNFQDYEENRKKRLGVDIAPDRTGKWCGGENYSLISLFVNVCSVVRMVSK